jgi:hypothetical protein
MCFDLPDIIEYLGGYDVHVFHLSKMCGDKEMRSRFNKFNITYDDIMAPRHYNAPYSISQIPYMFFFLDKEEEFEEGLKLLYPEKILKYTGSDFVRKFRNTEVI